MTKNEEKFKRYRYAWRRMKDAVDAGFYIEGIAIAESIISDRLKSFLRDQGANSRSDSFRTLIVETNWKCQELGGRFKIPEFCATDKFKAGTSWCHHNLIHELHSWRLARNTVVHGIVVSKADEGGPLPEAFALKAKKTAEEGYKYAQLICAWRDFMKREEARWAASLLAAEQKPES